MKRFLSFSLVFSGYVMAMLAIGVVAYNAGEFGLLSLSLDKIGSDSRFLIFRNALIASTALAFIFDFVRHRESRSA